MTDSVETKGAATDVVEVAADVAKPKDAPKAPARPRLKAAEPKARQEEPVKPAPAPEPIVAMAAPVLPQPSKKAAWLDTRAIAAATIGLVLGTAFGMVAAPRGSGESLAEVTAALEAGRTESARLNTEVERISNALATIRESSEAARSDGRSLGSGLTDRIGRLEKTLSQSVAGLGEKLEQAERAQGTRIAGLAAQIEKRPAIQALPMPAAAIAPAAKAEPQAAQKAEAASPAKPEPVQTGSIGDTKPKSEIIDGWAVREVFDGVAILESRRHRLIEVVQGVQIPGVGRVESIERRGRNWVVVTKLGIITPQTW